MSYDPSQFESKWRAFWKNEGIYHVEDISDKPKFYCLDMFPYPSGKGLHVGHPLGYIASDIVARYKRLKGFNVLHPMGFDAFGLPAEQYAIQTGIHPADSTSENLSRYKEQLDLLGLSYDWDRMVKTCDPSYYKWTQWIFIQLFEHYYDLDTDSAEAIDKLEKHFESHGSPGVHASHDDHPSFTAKEWLSFDAKKRSDILMCYRLAYYRRSFVNWCEALQTVLANDEVKDGLSERGGHPVVKKPMDQWSLRTSAYAQRLLDGLEQLDWPDSLKLMQINWIGKSEGARIPFKIKGHRGKIEVYTTRPDTLFGVSFMVLAPELDIVSEICAPECRDEINKYLNYVQSRSERDRMADMNNMTGVNIGAYAIHPVTEDEIPIFISEYVLKDYGTGAIMAVPDGDDRDRRFADTFDLPIKSIFQAKDTGEATLVHSEFLNGKTKEQAIPAMIAYLSEQGIGEREINFKLRDANFSRQRYWGEPIPIYFDQDNVPHALNAAELPLVLPDTQDFKPSADGQSPLAKIESWLSHDDGRMETDTMPGFAGSSWYYLRYMDPKNDKQIASSDSMNYWNSVDLYIGGAEHAVGHLLYSRMWCKFLYDIGLVPFQEPFQKLVNQGMIQGRSSLVYRANEKFAENHFREILKQNTDSFESQVLIRDQFGNTFSADFACRKTKIAIELKSQLDLERYYDRHRQDFESAGYKFVPISVEEVFYYYDQPELLFQRVSCQDNKSQALHLVPNTALFISEDRIQDESSVSALHVDVSIVYNDILDRTTFEEQRLDIEYFRYILSESGEYRCGSQVEKMSKSKFNVVNPDEVVAKYGTDCFRLYEMFLGPLEQSKPWETQNIGGVSKFLRKFYHLYYNDEGQMSVSDTSVSPSKASLKTLHTLINKIETDIDRLSLNTCISAFMIAVNELQAQSCHHRDILEPLCIVLAPFAPHLAEELWHHALGQTSSVHRASFPIFNASYLVVDEIEYPICINGKKKLLQTFSSQLDKVELEEAVLSLPQIAEWKGDKEIRKIIIVPKKMINLVIK